MQQPDWFKRLLNLPPDPPSCPTCMFGVFWRIQEEKTGWRCWQCDPRPPGQLVQVTANRKIGLSQQIGHAIGKIQPDKNEEDEQLILELDTRLK